LIFEQFFSPDGPSIFWVHNSPSDLAESRYLRQSPWSGSPVVKRGQIIPDDQKIKGDSGEKWHGNREIFGGWTIGVVGA